MLSILAQSLSC